MKVLVTGANGFLGRHVAAELASRGHVVRAMIEPGTSLAPLAGISGDVVAADLAEPASLPATVEGCDCVVHLAALVQEWGRWEWFEKVNVAGTRALANASAAAGVRRFLFMSSLAVHGKGDFVDGDESADRDHAGNPYARSKIECEDIVQDFHARGAIETVVIRPGMVPFGEGDRRGFGALAAAISKGFMPLTADPSHLTCTAYAPNLAQGTALALESPRAAGETFVIADAEKTSWMSYFQAIAARLDVKLRCLVLPCRPLELLAMLAERAWCPFGPTHRPPITSYLVRLMARNTHFSSEKAHRLLGYVPEVPLTDGIAAACNWWRAGNSLSLASKAERQDSKGNGALDERRP